MATKRSRMTIIVPEAVRDRINAQFSALTREPLVQFDAPLSPDGKGSTHYISSGWFTPDEVLTIKTHLRTNYTGGVDYDLTEDEAPQVFVGRKVLKPLNVP